MSNPFERQSIPRPALFGLALLVVLSIIGAAIARIHGFTAGFEEPPAMIEQRDLRFIDLRGGEVEVRDAATDAILATLDPGTENFVRGVLRSMARERRSMALGIQTPFRIARHEDGRLILQDLSTGRRIDLQAFGPSNADAFARLLAGSAQGS